MSKPLNIKTDNYDNPVMVEAKDWFFKVKDGPTTTETLDRYHEWLSADPEHREQFDLMHAIWNAAGTLKNDPEFSKIIKENLSNDQDFFKTDSFSPKTRRNRVFTSFAMAASILLLILTGWLTYEGNREKSQTYQTATGVQKIVYLADGSTVHLDTDTAVTSRVTDSLREIKMLNGRAFFSVVKDKKRPFLVIADEVAVRAVGTEFNVYKESQGRISVLVTEGSVQVGHRKEVLPPAFDKKVNTGQQKAADKKKATLQNLATATSFRQKALAAGQKIVVDPRREDFHIQTVDIEKANSWQTGRLYFQEAPLSEIVDEVNRYLEDQITIADPLLNNVTLSMNFDVKHRKRFLATLEKVLPISTRKNSQGHIIISRKQ